MFISQGIRSVNIIRVLISNVYCELRVSISITQSHKVYISKITRYVSTIYMDLIAKIANIKIIGFPPLAPLPGKNLLIVF